MDSDNKIVFKSILRKAWKDTEIFRQTNIIWYWGVEIVGAALFGVGGVFIGFFITPQNVSAFWQNAYPTIGGGIGVIVGFLIVFGLIFLWNLIKAPKRIRKEIKHEYIREHASYFSRIFGNKKRGKYLTILEILKSMVEIENEVTDSKAGKIQASPDEIKQVKRKFNEQTNLPLLPDSKALKIFLSGKADKKINQTINKLNLNIMGDKPTENQIEFFIKTRIILDESRFGIANGLPSEYVEYSRKFEELIQNDEELPDWMIFLLVLPSGINSSYLWYCCQGIERQKFFQQNIKTPENIKQIISKFKSQREFAINQLINYAEESIENM